MKKTYIRPQMMIVHLGQTRMIASSITGTNVEGLGNGGDTNGSVTEGSTKANNQSFWDY